MYSRLYKFLVTVSPLGGAFFARAIRILFVFQLLDRAVADAGASLEPGQLSPASENPVYVQVLYQLVIIPIG